MSSSPSPAVVPRPSACPGLWRIVEARDGGICRIKLAAGRLSAAQARAVAVAAQRCGSGVLELTNRSNLQLRGVRPEAADELRAALQAAGLAPASAAADDVRNLLISPAAGRDPAQLLDTRPLAVRLLALLEREPALHGLSAKFALLLDGGEALMRRDHPHDLWLAALPGGERLAFGLAGCPQQALGSLPLAQAELFVETLLRLFLRQPGSPRRMRELLAQQPLARWLQQVQQALPFRLEPVPPLPRREPLQLAPLGLHAQRQPGRQMRLVGVPLGRLQAPQLAALAGLAEQHADGWLQLTPWQGLLLADLTPAAEAALRPQLQQLGLLLDEQVPLARLVACAGGSGCARAQVDCKADARRLATRLPAGLPLLHLSGCARACAQPQGAPLTLLGDEHGRYQLFQRDPAQAGFGRLLAASLDIDQAGALLAGGLPE